MPAIGIIAEYNPFHNGHKYQLKTIRKKFNNAEIIVTMSGSITQRGETAILDKWSRAKTAVANGADLVIELPAVYAIRSAQDFARGGVRLFNSLNIVDNLAFGTEYPEDNRLQKAGEFLETSNAQNLLHEKIKKGLSYATAVTELLKENFGFSEDILREPNTILGLEYIRSIIHTGSAIKPLPLLRKGASHRQENISDNIASGTAIRQEAKKSLPDYEKISEAVPQEILYSLKENFADNNKLLLPLIYSLNNTIINNLQNIYGISEGIENRLLGSLKNPHSLGDILNSMTTRRYTVARCQRAIMYLLLGITHDEMMTFDNMPPQYVRVLAFNDTGRTLLKKIKEASPLPLITKTSDYLNSQDILNNNIHTDLQKMLSIDVKSTNLQGLCFNSPQTNLDFTTSPVYVNT